MIKGRVESTMPENKREMIIAYKQCFESESGRKVLEDLQSYCMYNTTPVQMRPSGIDPYEVLFLNGREDVVKYVLRNIDRDLPTG